MLFNIDSVELKLKGNGDLMQKAAKFQGGYLLVVAVILIVIVGFIGSLIAYMYVGSTRSNTSRSQSNAAFYIATSGLEVAKRFLVGRGQSCPYLTSNHTNITFPFSGTQTGQFSVTGNDTLAYNQLSGSITASTVNISAVNASTFSSDSGALLIENEIISYPTKVSNTFQNVKRGIAGTTAVAHPTAPPTTALIKQHMCVLQSTGLVPTTATSSKALGQRVLREPITMGMGYLPVDRSLPGLLLMPAVVGGHNVTLVNASTSVTNANIDGAGCAIAANGTVTAGFTYNCKATSGYANTVWQNDTEISNNATDFYNYFFNQSVASLEASGYQATSAAAINNIITVGQPGYGKDVVWYSGSLTLTSGSYLTTAPDAFPRVKTLIITGDLVINSSTGVTIGSAATPVKIIVLGNFTVQTSSVASVIYGFIFDDGNATLRGLLNVYGALAAIGNTIIGTAAQPATINFTQAVFDRLSASSVDTVQVNSEVFN